MDDFVLYSCLVLKYGSLILILFGGFELVTSFLLKEDIKTNYYFFLNGLAVTLCGLLMFKAMRTGNWELYMWAWIFFITAVVLCGRLLDDSPAPKSKLARAITSMGKSIPIKVPGKGKANHV